MTKKILITGGAVHCFIDSVKIISNRFRGGLMAKLAGEFVNMAENLHAEVKVDRGDKKADVHVTYLCSKSSQQPWWSDFLGGENTPHLTCIHHDGIDDYMKKVLELSPDMDAVILGAAVCNLIPKNKIEGKFPSHNYKPGDTIPIEFTIAERIIDQVKKANPKTLLFGYKLLENVDYYELISASYGVLLESKAVTVFANDAKDLMQKYAVTKERGVHPIHNDQVAQWILDRLDEKYYSTLTAKTDRVSDKAAISRDALQKIIQENRSSFITTDEGFVFGSAAYRISSKGGEFVTTARGKDEAASFAYILSVDHISRKIHCSTTKKASLNAPLFEWIFVRVAKVQYILHFHHQREDLKTMEYATPGTDKDSQRPIIGCPSFNIKGHGCILSFDKNGKMLK